MTSHDIADDRLLEPLGKKGGKTVQGVLTQEQLRRLLDLPEHERAQAMREMLGMKDMPRAKRSDDTI